MRILTVKTDMFRIFGLSTEHSPKFFFRSNTNVIKTRSTCTLDSCVFLKIRTKIKRHGILKRNSTISGD